MSTTSYTSLRRLSAFGLTLLLSFVTSGKGADAQVAAPLVTTSYATSLTPPSGLGKVLQTAVDSFGDLLFVDWQNGALYEYRAGGSAVVTLLPSGSLGGYTNPGIAIGASNDLYLGGNYNNCLDRFPYDPATKSWDGLSTISAANGFTSAQPCPNGNGGNYTAEPPYGFSEGGNPGVSPGYFQPWAIAIDPNNNVVITAQNSGNFIFTLPVIGTGVTSTAGTATSLTLDTSAARAQSVTEDKFGNIYFVEETDQTGALPGVLMIPAGSMSIADDSGLKRVDPMLPAVSGVTTDAAGNLYVSDAKLGVYFIPNPSGTPETASATLLTPVAASAQASIDQARGILYVPTYDASGNQVIDQVAFNHAELGSTAAGAPAAAASTITFSFGGGTGVLPVLREAGSAKPDFVITSGGTCLEKAVWAANSSCTVDVTFSPHAAGGVSADLLLVNPLKKTLASISLHGTGIGSAVQVLPAAESTIGSGLSTPSQIAVDAVGNTYVADAGLGAVEMYPSPSNSSGMAGTVGAGLTAPTGVAVDGGGDVFIADSGNVLEVPEGASGLNAAGQAVLLTGLGSNLKLATDDSDDLYIADPDNGRVVELKNIGGTIGALAQTQADITGFTSPSALAVDASGDLYVADGANLIEVAPDATKTTLLSTLNGVTGLAVDPSGSVYVAMTGGTLRIPNEGGTLTAADETMIAASVTSPASVAIDQAQNVYIADPTAKDVEFVGASASTNFGTQATLTSTLPPASYTVLNDGNAPLNITGFAGTQDFSATDNSCTGGPIAINGTCSLTVTFSPGPGDQGALAGEVTVTGDEANVPVGVNSIGVGAALANSKTTLNVMNPSVDSVSAVVNVAAAAGSGATPTGDVTLTITGGALTAPITVPGTLANGTLTITPPQISAGTYTFTVKYVGDRTYSGSSATAQVILAAENLTLIQPTLTQVQQDDPAYPYVLAAGAGSDEPYDGSVAQYEYNYQLQVTTANGAPLIGLPVYDSNGKQIATNYGSITLQGAPTSSCDPIPVAADGTATFQADCLTIDTSNNAIPDILSPFTVTPVYSPAGAGGSLGTTNPNYQTTTGTSISFTALRNPMVQITANPSTLSITAGSTATATLTLNSVLGYGVAGAGGLLNNYSLPVKLQCDGLPAYATCTFSYPNPNPTDPQSVDVGPPVGTTLSYMGAAAAPCTATQCAGPGTVVMTITTNVPTGDVSSLRGASETSFAAMFGLGLLGFVFGKKKAIRQRMLMILCVVLCGGILGGLSGCSTKQLGVNNGTPSPAGTYTVMVTAKQVGSQVITALPYIVYGNQNQVSLPFTMNVTIK